MAATTCTGLQAKHILIAVGGRATKIPIPGAEHAITSDEVLNLTEVPKRMACIGGGYISLEFASIYNHYGAEVHAVYRQVAPLGFRGLGSESRVWGLGLGAQGDPTTASRLRAEARIPLLGRALCILASFVWVPAGSSWSIRARPAVSAAYVPAKLSG